MKWVEFHHGMKFNLKEKIPLSMMKTYNKISHFCQSLKSEAWYVKNIRRFKARYIKWLRLNPEACNFIKKETLVLAFSCEFCQISNTCFTEHLWESASYIFFIFYLLCSSFFFLGFTFYNEALCFIIFRLSLCSKALNLENILEYVRQKL